MQLRIIYDESKLHDIHFGCGLAVLESKNNLVNNKAKSIIVVHNYTLKAIGKYPQMHQKSPQVVKLSS